ncbi:MAG: TlpA disulfide reductase family protein [Saprospiraceae bacterium]
MKKYKILKLLVILIIAFFAIPFFKNLYLKPSTGSGEAIKDFSAQLADGTDFKLSDLQGKYVLLDFWGSWCGPCIGEMPHIKELYNRFGSATFNHADGFTIVSVAVQKREDRWRRALDKYQMPWPYHIMDQAESLKFFDSPIAQLYGVKQVPTKFLINEKGVIIGVDQPIEEIAAFLEKEEK